MKNNFIISIFALLFLASCSSKPKNPGLTFSNDLENANCWSDNNTITYGTGHSGKVFSKVTPENQYSFTFHKALKDISQRRVKKAEYSAWVNLSSASSEATLVLSIDSSAKSLFWLGTSTKTSVAVPDKWVQIKGKATFPYNIGRDNEVKIYLWDNGKDAVLVDDFEITFKD